MFPPHLTSLIAASAVIGVVAAQTSLYIPGFDPQPISANVLGVGSDGRTTWQIAAGTPSGSLTDIGFIGTATLIAGPNDVQIIRGNDGDYVSEACTVGNGLADCTLVAAVQGEATSTETFQETASPFPIQVGPSAQPTAGGNPPPPASSSPPPADSSRTSGNSAPTQTPGPSAPSTASATPTNQPSSAIALAASSFFSGVVVIVAAAYMF